MAHDGISCANRYIKAYTHFLISQRTTTGRWKTYWKKNLADDRKVRELENRLKLFILKIKERLEKNEQNVHDL